MTEGVKMTNLYLPKSVMNAHDAESIRKWVYLGFFVLCLLFIGHWGVNHENMTSMQSQNTLAMILLSGMYMVASARSWWRWYHFKDEENLIYSRTFLFEKVFRAWPPCTNINDIAYVQKLVTAKFTIMTIELVRDYKRLELLKIVTAEWCSPYQNKEMEIYIARINNQLILIKRAISVADDWNFIVPNEVRELIK